VQSGTVKARLSRGRQMLRLYLWGTATPGDRVTDQEVSNG
jgi:hypothetical protein